MSRRGGISKFDIELARKLKFLRVLNGMSQSDLAEKMGVSFQQIQKYEYAQNKVSFSVLRKFIDIFGISWRYFFENDSNIEKLFCFDEQVLQATYTLQKLPDSARKALTELILEVDKCVEEKINPFKDK